MTTDANRWVYGPVASRRLGRSLGIDLVPFKTCSYDCVYCQLGRPQAAGSAGGRDVGGEVLALLGRRPSTVTGISDGLGLRPNEVVKHLEVLRQRGLVRTARSNGVVFYQAVTTAGAPDRTHRTGGEVR